MKKNLSGEEELIVKRRVGGIACIIAGVALIAISVLGLTGCSKVEDKVVEQEFSEAAKEIQEASMNISYDAQGILPQVQTVINEHAGVEVPIYQIYFSSGVVIVQGDVNNEPKMFKVTVPLSSDNNEWTVMGYELYK